MKNIMNEAEKNILVCGFVSLIVSISLILINNKKAGYVFLGFSIVFIIVSIIMIISRLKDEKKK